jgi:hypothetical protein
VAESHDSVVKRRSAIGRALGVGSVILGLVFLGGAQIRATQLVDRIDREAELRQAQGCVASYERVQQLRDGDEFVIRLAAETLIAVGEDPERPRTPEELERIERFKELVEGDVQEARDNYTVLTPCDLEKARALLETEKGNS